MCWVSVREREGGGVFERERSCVCIHEGEGGDKKKSV